MNACTTLIMAGGRGQRLSPLTAQRAKPAIRFGGTYRIIDFTLSNCLNSDLRRIYLMTQYASTSLERYIRHGWSTLFRSGLGECIETRPPQQLGGREWYEGTADCIYKNLDLVREEGNSITLILSGDHVYKMDYRKMIDHHQRSGADVSIACIEAPLEDARSLGVIEVDDRLHIKRFHEKPEHPLPNPLNPDTALCNMGVYCFSTDMLIDSLVKHYRVHPNSYDFGKHILPEMIKAGARVIAYPFEDENRKEQAYWRDIGTLDAYYEANMDLLEIDPHFNLYDTTWPVRSFIRQLPPAKTVFRWEDVGRIGMALESMISPGVIISGGKAFHSILSPEVRINSHALVEGSILFDRVVVNRNAIVRNAIVDRDVVIPEGARIGVEPENDRQRFKVTKKGITVISNDDPRWHREMSVSRSALQPVQPKTIPLPDTRAKVFQERA